MSARTMWDGQAELRWSMEQLADEAIDRAGVELDPRAFLVGLPEHDPFLPVLVEPSRRAFDVQGLDRLMEKAQRRFEALPEPEEQDEFTSSEHYDAARLEGCRRQVVVEALTTGARFAGRTLRVGLSVVVGDYRVFPVLAVLQEPLDSLPRLSSGQVDGMTLHESFPEAIMTAVLRAASRELDRVTPGTLLGIDDGAILRAAADSFVDGVVARTGQELHHGLLEALDAVSAETYEGRVSRGSLVLADRNHPCVQADVRFEHDTTLTAPSLFRKVLEMSAPDLRLLIDGREAYGLGSVDPGHDPASERCFTVDVVGNGAWELFHAGRPMLRVDHGQPSVPTEDMDPETFADTVRRVFGEDADATALWSMARACAGQQHGTMLVVHPDAAAEGRRLLPQAFTIAPTRLGARPFRTLTRIDGAVLVDPRGVCHAIGVILDGAATGTGDGSRGARYNSAIRYLAGEGRGSMVIIVSEDGRIDLLPILRQRVRRDAVQRRVDQFVLAVQDQEDHEKIARLDEACERLEFYLTHEQCKAVNDAREAVAERRWAEERLRLQVVPVQPHPAMDDSYFIDPA